jgi:hypothetical protein
MKNRFLNFIVILLFGNVSFGQDCFRDFETRVKTQRLTLYETLQAKYLTKNTNTFGLKGNVKSLKESVDNSPNDIIHYEFLENGNLYFFQKKDTLQRSIYTSAKFEQYSFDENTNQLSEIIEHRYGWKDTYKTVIKLDKKGFVIQEIDECYMCGPDYERDGNIFDHSLKYDWNATKDTVNLKYSYVIPSDREDRHLNRTYFFTNEIKTKKDSTFVPDSFGFLPYPEFFEYDKNGNLIKWTMLDLQPKGSFNTDSSIEYEYNEYGELITISTFSRIHNGTLGSENWLSGNVYNIKHLEYDNHGNWTRKKIIRTSMNLEPKACFYKREISYYK